MDAIRLSDEALEVLQQICPMRQFGPGKKITTKDNQARSMFFLLSGWVEIRFQDVAGQVCSLQLGEKSALGEIGFLTGKSSNATAVAKGQVICLEIDEATMARLESEQPAVHEEFTQYLTATKDKRLQ